VTLGFSPQLRLALLAALLGIAVLSGGVLVLPKLKAGSGSTTVAQTTQDSAAAPAQAPAAPSEPKPAASSEPPPARAALPAEPQAPVAVAQALASSPVVVVALFAPGVGVDAQALAEARRGAAAADAGFAAVNVADESAARWLVAAFDGTTDPAVLVFRHGQLATRLLGYVDAEIVAQAASR
jgi:hypothetical protein